MPEARESMLDGGDTTVEEPLELPAAAASSDWRGLAMAVCLQERIIQAQSENDLDSLSRSQCAKRTAA